MGGVVGADCEVCVGDQVTAVDKANKRLEAAREAMDRVIPFAHSGVHRCCKHMATQLLAKSIARAIDFDVRLLPFAEAVRLGRLLHEATLATAAAILGASTIGAPASCRSQASTGA